MTVSERIALVWLDPQKVDRWSPNPPSAAVPGGTSVLGGNWDRTATPFRDSRIFRALHERFILGRAWEETALWDRLEKIEAGVPLFGCRSEEDFRQHLAAVDWLYETIATEGYKTHRELGPPHDPGDELGIGIGRDGALIALTKGLMGGRHRLAIAQLLELPRVPARVLLRHEQWAELRAAIERIEPRVRARLCELLGHPDLDDLAGG